jgi:hypothetical protein
MYLIISSTKSLLLLNLQASERIAEAYADLRNAGSDTKVIYFIK